MRTADSEPQPEAEPDPDAAPGDGPVATVSPESSEPEGDSDLVLNELLAQHVTPAPYEAGLVDREVTRRPRRAQGS